MRRPRLLFTRPADDSGRFRWQLSVESLTLLACVFFALAANRLFFEGMLAGYSWAQPKAWLYAFCLALGLSAAHFVLLALVATRWTIKPILVFLFIATAFAEHFMSRYRVFLDTTMLRNVMATDVREAGDLMTWSLLPQLLFYAALPIFLMSRVSFVRRSWGRALLLRLATIAGALAVLAAAIFINFQDFASSMRNQRELRFLITPANYVYSLAQTMRSQAAAAELPRQAIGEDARPGEQWAARKRPVVLVMVLGETVRAANWGLSGYARQTTPELAAEPGVINFAQVTSCGTNTEVSVPCIFSPWGRRHYDETKIRSSQSVLDVVARAGFRVVWIDNQAGCKGVCDGVEFTRPNAKLSPSHCQGDECQDAAMVDRLRQIVEETPGNLLVVMHQMGNHGPAYFKRYPDEFRHYLPACDNADLARCPLDSIVNAYDNAIRYTDHVLATTVQLLRNQGTHDAALLYVSDHGESLGENGLYLHGIPYAIAPAVQTQVPMVWWLGDGFASQMNVDRKCLARVATQPQTHDHLFHTLLGVLDIRTSIYEKAMDFIAGCRPAGG